ncbi:hypothetical protein FOL47_010571 [Perkinsus chesapeaki]|uniref:UDP-GalNAc:beta-1,3-N-acetylgalactosaminyltransferase 2 n=1 Tax=Perkinsus chesapeaki TaxID=330153 RepID=A0A7J6MP92_PERCH|nr:hypothetical protein FOL47_010571 [Perkinsus chesapeaki]
MLSRLGRFITCTSLLVYLCLISYAVAAQQQPAREGDASLKEQEATTSGYDWDLVIVIPSHISEFTRRCAVRDGWARQLKGHEQSNRAGLRSIKLVFTVGAHYPDDDTKNTALAEMKQFGDMITLPSDFVDRYDALGTKVRLSFKEAVDRLGRFRLLLKADTDSYVHVDKLLEFFDRQHMWDGDPVYAGSFRHAPVMWEPENKDHKWFDGKFTQMTGLTQYPWNAQGGGYVISYQLAKYLAHPPLQLKSWTHEDVGVGAWLMALDYRRIDMPVGFSAPECDCALKCIDRVNDLGGRDLVIDHYVPPYLHRIRQRRLELLGDECWIPQAPTITTTKSTKCRLRPLIRQVPPKPLPAAGPVAGGSRSRQQSHPEDDVIPVNSKCYEPMWLGGEDLQNEYAFSPLQLSPDTKGRRNAGTRSTLLEDHTDTRSGVCGIQFHWEPSSSSSSCMVCRGSDGYDYDEFECGDPSSVVPAYISSIQKANSSLADGVKMDGPAFESESRLPASVFSLPLAAGQWQQLSSVSDCTSPPIVRRELLSLPQCQHLAWSGHYTVLKWIPRGPTAATILRQQQRPPVLALGDAIPDAQAGRAPPESADSNLDDKARVAKAQLPPAPAAAAAPPPDAWGDCVVYDQFTCHRAAVASEDDVSVETVKLPGGLGETPVGSRLLFFLPTQEFPSPPPLEDTSSLGIIRTIGDGSVKALSAAWLLSIGLVRFVSLIFFVFVSVKLIAFLLRRCSGSNSSTLVRGRSRSESGAAGSPGSKLFMIKKLAWKLFRDCHPANASFNV